MYRECLCCGNITDEDEVRCSACGCGINPFERKSITLNEVISRIEKGDILRSSIWTKNPEKFSSIPVSPP